MEAKKMENGQYLDGKSKLFNSVKRRKKNKTEWKREIRKRLRVSGKAYENTKGKLVEPKSIGPDCKCSLNCYGRLNQEVREKVFEGFYSLKSYDEQNAYLSGLIKRQETGYDDSKSIKKLPAVYKYFIRINGKATMVCRVAFANIHAISVKKIRVLCSKLEKDILYPRDNRGKHTNRPFQCSSSLSSKVRNHVYSVLNNEQLHDFVRNNEGTCKPKLCEVNVSKLYKDFLQKSESAAVDKNSGAIPKDRKPEVKLWLYRKIYKEELQNVSFRKLLHKKITSLFKSSEAKEEVKKYCGTQNITEMPKELNEIVPLKSVEVMHLPSTTEENSFQKPLGDHVLRFVNSVVEKAPSYQNLTNESMVMNMQFVQMSNSVEKAANEGKTRTEEINNKGPNSDMQVIQIPGGSGIPFENLPIITIHQVETNRHSVISSVQTGPDMSVSLQPAQTLPTDMLQNLPSVYQTSSGFSTALHPPNNTPSLTQTYSSHADSSG